MIKRSEYCLIRMIRMKIERVICLRIIYLYEYYKVGFLILFALRLLNGSVGGKVMNVNEVVIILTIFY